MFAVIGGAMALADLPLRSRGRTISMEGLKDLE